MEAIDIINKLRINSYGDKRHPKSPGGKALSWQILYHVTRYLEDPSALEGTRRGCTEGKSLAMNYKRIARYLKHYGNNNNQTNCASD
jgi:hypothetical protein